MLRIANIEVSKLNIPFNMTFSHASASRNSTQSILVKVTTTCGLVGYGEGCPREYVTDESLDSAMVFIECKKNSVFESIHDLVSLENWVNENESEIDAHPAAWCAVELAVLDVIAKLESCSIEKLLEIEINRETFTYTAVLGNSELHVFEQQVNQYKKLGLQDFKVKITGNLAEDNAKLDIVVQDNDLPRIRMDANNLWKRKEDVINYLKLLNHPIYALEEPLAPEQYDDLRDIARETGIQIILDESFQRRLQLSCIVDNPGYWILNIRVSKMGGLIRSLDIINKAQDAGIPIIVGAHVGETSLLTRAGLVIAQAAHNVIIGQEGGFGTYLLKYDIWKRPLQFKKNGKLYFDLTKNVKPGFGLHINSRHNSVK